MAVETLRAGLLDAILSLAADLDLATVLHRVVEAACKLSGARYGALGVIGHDQTLQEFVTHGLDDDTIAAIGDYPTGKGVLGTLIVHPEPLRLHEVSQHADSYGFPPHHPPMHSFLGVPIRVRGEVFGNLYLTDKIGADDFTADDEELVIALAGAAGVAIENARLHRELNRLALLEDRERIGRDLHDTVIQRLFATGMAIEGTARLIEDFDVRERLERAVDDLDKTIRDIRTTIFALQSRDRVAGSLGVDIRRLAAEASRNLGFEPEINLDGHLDDVPGQVGDDALATLREMLANVARHAKARKVVIRVVSDKTKLQLEVVDDGVGLPPDLVTGGHGLHNMEERAKSLRGAFELSSTGDGTHATWWVPLPTR